MDKRPRSFVPTTVNNDPTNTNDPTSLTDKKPVNNNPFIFTDDDITYLGEDTNTPIARAWARAHARGIELGKPLDTIEETTTQYRQLFAFAQAVENKDSNPNFLVQFSDGRGLIIEESGL